MPADKFGMWDIVQNNSSNLFCKLMSYLKEEEGGGDDLLNQFSQPKMILSSVGVTMSGEIFDCHNVRSATGI